MIVEQAMKKLIGNFFTWKGWPKIKETIGTVLIVCIGLFCLAYFATMIALGLAALVMFTISLLHGQGGIVAFLFMCALWWMLLDVLAMLIGAQCSTRFRIWLGGSKYSTRNCNTVTGTLVRKAYAKFKSTMEDWAKGGK